MLDKPNGFAEGCFFGLLLIAAIVVVLVIIRAVLVPMQELPL